MGKRLDPLKNKDMLIWTWTILLWISAPNHLGKRLDPPKNKDKPIWTWTILL